MGLGLIFWLVFFVFAVAFLLTGAIIIYLWLKGKNKRGWIVAVIGMLFICITIASILAMFGFWFGWGVF